MKRSIFVLSIVIIGMMIGGCSFGSEKNEIQSKITNYLKNKYNKDFVVEKPKFSSSTGFGVTSIGAYAYPVDNLEIKILVTGSKEFPDEWDDNYVSQSTNYEGGKVLKARLSALYGQDVILVDYSVGSGLVSKEMQKLPHDELLKNYGKDLSVVISYYVFVNDNIDKKREEKNLWDIYNDYIIKNEIGTYGFHIDYLNKNLKKDFDIEKYGREYDIEKYKNEKKLINGFSLRDDKLGVNKENFINYFIY